MSLVLNVTVAGTLVGLLRRDANGAIRFTPDADWLRAGQQPRLGLAFLQDPNPRLAGTGLPLWFENLLPEEGSFLRQRICHRAGIRETDSPSLLRLLGRDLPGAAVITGDLGDSEKVESGAELAATNFSLAGMQLKFSMLASGQKFVVPGAGELGDWIVKVPGARLENLPEVEHWTMRWAEMLGLDVPETRIVAVEDLALSEHELQRAGAERALAVARFDRGPDGTRIHQEDFAQALEFHPTHKYSDSGPRRTTYDALAKLINDVCGRPALETFARNLAFVIGSGNGDAHLKNFAFLWPENAQKPQLAPVYDQVATVTWQEFGWCGRQKPRLALSFGRSRELHDLTEDRVRTFAERCGEPSVADLMISTLELLIRKWTAISAAVPPAMKDGVERHFQAVPLLRRLKSGR